MANNNKHTGPNVPALRFPEFSEEWEQCQIKDFGKVITGSTPPTSKTEYYDNGEFLWASPADLGNVKDVISTKTKLSQQGFDKCRKIPAHSILVTCIGSTIGKMGMATTEMATNQQINSIIPIDCNPDYVYYSIQSRFPKYITSIATQAVPILSKSVFESLDSYKTSIEEQNKIGKLFHLLDERIDAQSKIIEELTTLRSALIEECAKQSGNCISLSDILREVEERSTTANQYQVLSSTVKGIFSQKEYFNKDIASEDNKGYKVVRRGHIVLSPQNLWMGNINYNDRFDIGIVSPSYKVFSIKEGFNPIFIAALLQTKKALNEYMLASEQGASIVRRNLNIEAFMAIKFRIPDARQQDSLSLAITAINAKLNNEQCYLEQLTMQKSCLLENMFI